MLIEIAGVDGSGKSTQIDHLARTAQDCAVPCYERSLRSTGRRIVSGIAAQRGHDSWREVFDRGAVELATALEMYQLFHATVQTIRFPGQIIVTDTYVRSWLAVAIGEGGCDLAQLGAVYRAMPVPDLSIQLDCDVDTAFDRILARPKGDHLLRTGGKDRLRRLAEAYGPDCDELVHYDSVHVPATCPAPETAAAILDLIVGWADRHDRMLHERLVTGCTHRRPA